MSSEELNLRFGAFTSDERRLIRNGLESTISFFETVDKDNPHAAEEIEKNRALLDEVVRMEQIAIHAPLYLPPQREESS